MKQPVITITLNQEEEAALTRLLDAAVRHLGLGAAEAAIHIAAKMRQAAAQTPMAKAD